MIIITRVIKKHSHYTLIIHPYLYGVGMIIITRVIINKHSHYTLIIYPHLYGVGPRDDKSHPM